MGGRAPGAPPLDPPMITLNGFVNPRVYEQTFRATINVGSVMLFMEYYFIQYVPKYHQKLGCQANGAAHTGRTP